MPHVRVLSTGGTIAGTDGDDGVAPTERAEDLVSAVPELADHATVDAEQVVQLPSSDMSLSAVADVVRAVRAAADDGVDAVVITHGTDTMEESAYFLDLALAVDVPVVFTGAMRHADHPSPDGPGNLLSSVRVAAHPRFREGGGVFVSLDDEVHAARTARKLHTSATGTFASPDAGPVATVGPQSMAVHRQPRSESTSIPATEPSGTVVTVSSGVGVEGRGIEWAIEAGVDGVVVEGTGLGHATRAMADRIDDAVDGSIPVVVTSRCPAGELADVYESGRILGRRGAIFASGLSAHKARIKLLLALEATDRFDGVRELFEDRT